MDWRLLAPVARATTPGILITASLPVNGSNRQGPHSIVESPVNECPCVAKAEQATNRVRERKISLRAYSVRPPSPPWLNPPGIQNGLVFAAGIFFYRGEREDGHGGLRTRAGRDQGERIPATQAVMKEARVPAIMARMPSRARSPRRSGTIAPMPPICTPIEPKLAKPQKA